MKIKIFFGMGLAILLSVSAHAQQDEAAVKGVIAKLFDGMHEADSSKVRSVFTPDLTMATVSPNRNTGKPSIERAGKLVDFLSQVGTKRPEPLTEEIWNLEVKIDGDFAQAWCDYAFYVGKNFSHCGVDAFHLFKTADGWKIFHIADTRRRDGCSIPEDIQSKYK